MSAAATEHLNYIVEGPENAPSMVLVHGVGANLASWDAVAERLVPKFRVLRMDLRGHGSSSPIRERWALGRFAEDVISVLDRESVDGADLVGFSLGGLIAQHLALHWPGRFDRLILLSTVAGRTPEEREKVVGRLAMLREGGITAITGAARERWFTEAFARKHPEKIDARIQEMLANDLESYIEAYRVFGESELASDLHRIPHRTLVMTGENDIGSNTRMARFMHQQIRNSELRVLPELKHSVLVEAPDLIADHLLRFLNRSNAAERARVE
ncbi:alpha/beta fold hydrolase [Limibacillus halophilus]|uniref:Pimeloyl-ACP methyl ester carboxylesterase n=1 Tax=Limibacillus halophilus TaxID=1579333 RepID=A0A839ST39_9PROT|nr:alpha/beta fold hydrolase [Limibacillus halophilus]MBB3064516.1 pimeloyl-ACP methyl ester carboxylesterase [Limibacillus halophilus]